VVWNEGTWESELAKGLAEMRRILRPGGSIIILETLGTGHVTPKPPDNLVDYYSFLEHQGFSASWIRTDYRFESLEEAEEIVRFFFGEAMVDEIANDGSITLPECTGIWWRKIDE
jgi:ubiquinone/menaquinone biosynthesis C-methylase UbiE